MPETRKQVSPPQIRHMATLWTLTGYGGKKGEWSIDEKLKRIRKAGFDGFLGRVPAVTREHVERHGLLFA
ncbi:MAG: xylose isomerase, partial [Candidatus Latescibacteria bacterium]|nr:xylose isomerase [Candidatus Latescibacterota bacterium]